MTLNLQGTADVEFVTVADPSQLTGQDLASLTAGLQWSGNGPHIVIVNSTPNDKIVYDAIPLTGGTITASEGNYTNFYDVMSLFPAYYNGNYYAIYGGAQKVVEEGVNQTWSGDAANWSSVTSQTGMNAYSVNTEQYAYGEGYTSNLTIDGLVNGDAGINVNAPSGIIGVDKETIENWLLPSDASDPNVYAAYGSDANSWGELQPDSPAILANFDDLGVSTIYDDSVSSYIQQPGTTAINLDTSGEPDDAVGPDAGTPLATPNYDSNGNSGNNPSNQQAPSQGPSTPSGAPTYFGGNAPTRFGSPTVSGTQDYGSSGSDGFDYASGDGQLNVYEDAGNGAASNATLDVGGDLTASDVMVTSDSSGDLILTDGVAGDQVVLSQEAVQSGGDYEYGVAEVTFTDGSSLTRSQLLQQALTGSASTTTLYGTSAAEVINPDGFAQTAQGGGGADTFIYNPGYGQFEINEDAGAGQATAAVLQVGGGLTASDIQESFDAAGDAILTDGLSGDAITLDKEILQTNQSNEFGVSQILFSDGSSISQTQLQSLAFTGSPTNTFITGTSAAQTIDPAGYATYIDGEGGADTFIYNPGYGVVTIQEYAAANESSDAIVQVGGGLTAADLTATFDAYGDVTLSDGTAGDQIDLLGERDATNGVYGSGVAAVTFSDGTSLTRAELLQDALIGSASNTAITGTSAAEVIDPAGQATSAVGGGGADTFLYSPGYGDVSIAEDAGYDQTTSAILQIGGGLTASDITVNIDDSGDVTLTDAVSGDQITLEQEVSGASNEYGVASVDFSDGSSITQAQMQADALTGSPTRQELTGTSAAEVIDPAGYASFANGGGGDDTFIYNPGYGAVRVFEDAGPGEVSNATLQIGGSLTASDIGVSVDANGNVTLTDGQSGDQIELLSELNQRGGSYEYGVGDITFSNGTSITRADLQADTLIGSPTNTRLYGTPAAEVLNPNGYATFAEGDGGADTFLYSPGFGFVEVDEDAGSGQISAAVLQVSGALTASDIQVGTDGYGDLDLIDGVNGDVVRLDGELNADGSSEFGVSEVTFSDGSSISRAELDQMALTGSPSNTFIVGTTNSELIDPAGYASFVNGGGGADTFIYNPGYGQVRIDEDAGAGAATSAILQIGGDLTASDFQATFGGSGAAVLTDGVDGDQITLNNELSLVGQNYEYGVSEIIFADGSKITQAQLQQEALIGSPGNTRLYGTPGADLIDPAGYATYAQGDGGADTFIYNPGYGQVEFSEYAGSGEATSAILQVGGGLTAADLQASFDSAGDVILTDGLTGDQITLDGEVTSDYNGVASVGISEITFADGSSITQVELEQDALIGSPTHERIYGTVNAEILDPRGYANYVQGNGGADTFVYNPGYGQVEINEQSGGVGGLGVLQVGGDLTASDFQASFDSAGDVYLTDGIAGDEIRLDGELSTTYFGAYESGVSEITFSDGTSISQAQLQQEAVTGSPANTVLYGSANAEVINPNGYATYAQGGGGADTFIYAPGYGNFEIDENGGYYPTSAVVQVSGDLTASDFRASFDAAGDVTLTDGINGDQLTIDKEIVENYGSYEYGVTEILFSDGTSITQQQLADEVNSPDYVLDGSAGNMTLNGFNFKAENTFLGGNGDTLNGANSDIYELTSNAGTETINSSGNQNSDSIVFDSSVNESDVTLQATGNSLIITDAAANIAITVNNEFWSSWWGGNQVALDTIQFADGTVWNFSGDQNVDLTWDGSAGGQTLTGSSWGSLNTFIGGNGDTLNGFGTDVYKFGSDAGVETINPSGNENTDAIVFDSTVNEADVTLQAVNNNLIVTDQNAGLSITVNNEFWNSWGNHVTLNTISFADGTVWNLSGDSNVDLTWDGSAGGQTLTGSGWGTLNTFIGGAGDTLNGSGTDLYQFGDNMGAETINLGSSDTLTFGDSVTSSDLWFVQSGSDLQIDEIGTTNQIVVKNWENDEGALTAIDTSDGLQLDSQLNALINEMATYTADNPGFNPVTATSFPNDANLQSSLAAAWHTR